jgi:amino acid adenylation domain-containing protein
MHNINEANEINCSINAEKFLQSSTLFNIFLISQNRDLFLLSNQNKRSDYHKFLYLPKETVNYLEKNQIIYKKAYKNSITSALLLSLGLYSRKYNFNIVSILLDRVLDTKAYFECENINSEVESVEISITKECTIIDWLLNSQNRDGQIEDILLVKARSLGISADELPFELLFNLEELLNDRTSREPSSTENNPLSINSFVILSLEFGSESILKINFDPNYYRQEIIERISVDLTNILTAIITNPQQLIGNISLPRSLKVGSSTSNYLDRMPEYVDKNTEFFCTHQLWEQKVTVFSKTVAVIWEDLHVSYGELNDQANKLAHYLRELGVKPETIVGIYLEKSISRIVALLAVFKAGGAYLPVDPAYPPDRVRYILEDSQTEIIITQESLKDELQTKAQIINLDVDKEIIDDQASCNPENVNIESHLAYIIYTSGSTGKPKGVQIEHKDISSHCQTIIEHYQITERDRVLQFASAGFDVSLEQILPTSIAGATLVLDETKHLTGKEFQQKIQQLRLTIINLPPAYWSQWVRDIARDMSISEVDKGNLRLVICGGEAMSSESLKLWRNSPLRDIRLLNAYGPTETTITATTFEIDKDREYERVPIGRPLAKRQAYILDSNLTIVPMGTLGELYLGGVGVARGYLNRPELTGEKFIDNPFGEGKLYRTGDVVRYGDDGNIEFVGRIDSQVKIRGFRIELGEIEAVLCQHPEVGEAVVVVREDIGNDKRLVVYIVPVAIPPCPPLIRGDEMRSFLRQFLPDYMIPAAFVVLEKFPLTVNGKIDRQALPRPEIVADSRDIIASSNPQEEILVDIWREVLKIEAIGIEDNFFELGGHSLLATQVVSRIREAFQVDIPLRGLFESPTIRGLALRLNREDGRNRLTLPPIGRRGELERDNNINIPLSFTQERLWFLSQLEGDAATYNIAFTLKLTGKLDVGVLRRSIISIVERHEILRTNFIDNNGSPVQVISPHANIDLSVIDLQGLTEAEKLKQVEAIVTENSRYSFDLTTDSLLRTHLIRLGEESHLLLVTIHHIVSDGWSMGIFQEELVTFYQAYSLGEVPALTPLPIQYADFAIWQKQYLSPEVLSSQLDYWRGRLAGLPPLLELPADKPRSPQQSFVGSSLPFELSIETTEGLKRLARELGVTVYMILLATLAVLLSRYSRRTDIPIGTAIANRNRQEVESLMGFFVNTLVMRVNLDDNPSFIELSERVRRMGLEGFACQDVPFEKVVEALQPERSLSYHPLFQVMFVWQNTPRREWDILGSNIVAEEVHTGTAKFDLTLSLEERGENIAGFWEYSTDLFEVDTIARMMGHFQNLLSEIVGNPDTRVEELPILSMGERRQLLCDWNRTAAAYPQDKCIHQLFEERVIQTPEAVALVWEEERVTYNELNEKANRLAHYLKGLGVEPDVLVGVCLERSIEMVVGILAILKAGGAYLPLDPAYPKDRSTFMLDNARASILLSQQSLLNTLPTDKVRVICLDADWDVIGLESPENLDSGVDGNNLAYTIYSSGSTGVPKGIAIAHRSTVNFIIWARSTFSPTQLSGVLASTSICFDLSVFELFVPLSCGGKVILAINALYLPTLPAAEEVTLINTVPSAIAELCRTQSIPASVTTINLAGEPLTGRLVEQIYQQKPDVKVFNLYGPSETTTYSTYTICESNGETPNIGRPLANTQIYILDHHLQPLPIGVAGELYIGGDGLAREYLYRPDLTAEKFIPNPFGMGRLYKTGDSARYFADGNIDFLGRLDNQVKLRGFRIELGEIEAVLCQHPNIKEAVAIVREDNPNDRRLVAYIVPSGGDEEGGEELREFVRRKLPDYMIPAVFVVLERLPLTPNGKIDRRALPIPIIVADSDNYIAPRTPQEEVLAAIWREVLNLEVIGIEDNFFGLGGHSLLATQVVSRIREAFKVDIPLRSLFESPTIVKLAEYIDTLRESLLLASILPAARGDKLPLSFGQQRLWFLNQLEPDSIAYNMPYGFSLQGLLNVNALERSWREIVRRYEILRTVFPMVDGEAIQVILPDFDLEIPIIDLQGLIAEQKETEAKRIAKEESEYIFNLAENPPIRVKILRLDDRTHYLLINLHHIIFDGWSSQILFAELSHLYRDFVTSNPTSLADINLQYADFTIWQREWLSGEILDSQLAYWKQQLGGNLPILELPIDRPHSPIQEYRSRTEDRILAPDITEGLKEISRQEGTTLFMTLLAAFKLLLYRYSGQEDIIIGTPIAGRNRNEIERIIGFFVNSLVLRTDLSGNPSFRELLTRVREVTLGAYSHQDLPFEKLVEELQPERDLNRTPLFQVWFNMVNVTEGKLDLIDLQVEPVTDLEMSSKFDLNLYLREKDNYIQVQWVYNAVLFDADTIAGMAKHFDRLLSAIIANPEQSISSFFLLTEAKRQQLLSRRNSVRPTNDFNEFLRSEIEQSISARFQQQVIRYGDRIAIETDNYCWTYRELNRQANRIASKLLEILPNRHTKIALLCDRDVSAIATILGVLKTGNIYIPLDPKYPQTRVAYILEDSQASLILTDNNNWERARELNESNLPIINIDTIEVSENIPAINLEIAPDSIAYLLYTSGSTGQPKGVVQNHRNILHFIRNYTNNLHISPEDRLSLLASYSFDAAVIDIFSALLNGASLYPFEIQQKGLANLSNWLQEKAITIYHSTPTVYRYFLDDLDLAAKEDLKHIRLIVLGGEEVVKKDVELYHQYFPDTCIFVNGLGSTESSFNLQCLIDKNTAISRNTVSVGYPFDDTEILLLDVNGKPTDILGEIAIKSPHIALGYWRKPELTAKVFLTDTNNPNYRIYRTGDWGRLRADGSLEFLGRKDFQVKIRGFRIELGEIESTLQQHPNIKETIVIARENDRGDRFLVAYIVPLNASEEIEQWRNFLRQKLPDYMIPTTFIILERMPLTPNGKIDRRALPISDNFRQESAEIFVAPRDDLELQLARIWEEVLELENIGVYDNFFNLGGNSLLAVKLLARLDRAFPAKIPLKALFQLSNIALLADILRQEVTKVNNPEISNNTNSEELYPELTIVEKRWLLASTITKKRVLSESSLIMVEQAGDPTDCKPLFFVSLLGELGRSFDKKQPVYNLTVWTKVEQHDTFIQALAAYYVKEIITIQPSGSYTIGGYCVGGWVAFEIAKQLQELGKEVDLLMLVQTPNSDPVYNKYQSLLLRCGYSFWLSLIANWRNFFSFNNQQKTTYLKQKISQIFIKKKDDPTERYSQQYRENLAVANYSEDDILKSLRMARKSYIPQPYNGKVALFFAREGQQRSFLFPQGGLGKILKGRVSTHVIPGNHTSILRNPKLQILAREMKTCLDTVNVRENKKDDRE